MLKGIWWSTMWREEDGTDPGNSLVLVEGKNWHSSLQHTQHHWHAACTLEVPDLCLLKVGSRDMKATCRAPGLVVLQEHRALTNWCFVPSTSRSTSWLGSWEPGRRDSQSHLPLQAGSHVRGRLSALLCGKEAGAVSILFHICHELCPTDMRSHERNSLPLPQQLLNSRGEWNTPDFWEHRKPLHSTLNTDQHGAKSKNSPKFAWWPWVCDNFSGPLPFSHLSNGDNTGWSEVQMK